MAYRLNVLVFFHLNQESPTGELVDYSFSPPADSNDQESESGEKTPQLDLESDVDAQTFCGPDGAQEKNREDGKFSENVKVRTSQMLMSYTCHHAFSSDTLREADVGS